MIPPARILSVAPLALLAAWSVQAIPTPHRVFAAGATTVNCSATTLRLRPGLHPPDRYALPSLQPAADSPRGRFTVSLPVYPGANPLKPYVDSPFSTYPIDPYLQTSSAEYLSADGPNRVQSWFARVLPRCGWHHSSGFGGFLGIGGGGVFTHIVIVARSHNPNLNLLLSLGSTPSGGTYIGYAVEEIILPPRPASSYLTGPFVEMRIALGRTIFKNGQTVQHVTHTMVVDRRAIERLVGAVNAIKEYRTVFEVPFICRQVRTLVGPAWLSFIRADGAVVHAYERGPGVCGGLAVNGARWLIDPGALWTEITSLAVGRG